MLTSEQKARIVGLAMAIRQKSYNCGSLERSDNPAEVKIDGMKSPRDEMEEASESLHAYLESICEK